jgi:hypothetical protein
VERREHPPRGQNQLRPKLIPAIYCPRAVRAHLSNPLPARFQLPRKLADIGASFALIFHRGYQDRRKNAAGSKNMDAGET